MSHLCEVCLLRVVYLTIHIWVLQQALLHGGVNEIDVSGYFKLKLCFHILFTEVKLFLFIIRRIKKTFTCQYLHSTRIYQMYSQFAVQSSCTTMSINVIIQISLNMSWKSLSLWLSLHFNCFKTDLIRKQLNKLMCYLVQYIARSEDLAYIFKFILQNITSLYSLNLKCKYNSYE